MGSLVPYRQRNELSWCLHGKQSTCQCRRLGFDPWVGKIPWRRKLQPTPVLHGESHGQRSLVGYSPWNCKSVTHDLATKQQRQRNAWLICQMCPVWWRGERKGSLLLATADWLQDSSKAGRQSWIASEGTHIFTHSTM